MNVVALAIAIFALAMILFAYTSNSLCSCCCRAYDQKRCSSTCKVHSGEEKPYRALSQTRRGPSNQLSKGDSFLETRSLSTESRIPMSSLWIFIPFSKASCLLITFRPRHVGDWDESVLQLSVLFSADGIARFLAGPTASLSEHQVRRLSTLYRMTGWIASVAKEVVDR